MEGATISPTTAEPSGPRGFLASYKEDQGRHVRMVAFWSIVFFLGFGCRFLHDVMIQWEDLRAPLGGVRIPVVGVNLSPAFLVSGLVFCAGLLVVHRWQQRPKMAELLIETEAELKRVSWPKAGEVWNASIVVMVSVVLLGGILAVADMFLYRLLVKYMLGIE